MIVLLTMSLEQDLKQERFTNDYEKMVVNILFTGSWLANLNAARLKPFGVTPEQYNVLRILRGSHPKPLMLADITCRMIDRSSNATRLVEKLRQKGLVKREICENNRRQVDISITDPGLEILAKIDEGRDRWLEHLKGVSKEEVEDYKEHKDPIEGMKAQLIAEKVAKEDEFKAIEADIKKRVSEAAEFAQTSPEPDESELWTDIVVN